MATKHGYARSHLGGGNVLKAVTRVKRSGSGKSLGRAPGRMPGPAIYKKDIRALTEELMSEEEV